MVEKENTPKEVDKMPKPVADDISKLKVSDFKKYQVIATNYHTLDDYVFKMPEELTYALKFMQLKDS